MGPEGHLYTFDFHEARAQQALSEFAEHGLASVVTASCRDVCNTGFNLDDIADAVFLDLPSPWLAIAHARQSLRKDRLTRIACFSPCMEQVQRTLPVLLEEGFCELEMFEIVLRPLEVEEIALSARKDTIGQKRVSMDESPRLVSKYRTDIKGHTSYLYFASLLPQRQP